ncbi:excinuclease ABC subunit UvrC [Patescibacteria group bacterium]
MPEVNNLLKDLPTNPGVYLFKNKRGKILYIGKAKNLINRVRSYFNRSAGFTLAKKLMVEKIFSIETILTNTETEAILLESTLIKRHQPPYNVALKDDKHFLYIKISDDQYPTLETVRRIGSDRSRYFGPYASTRSVRVTLKMLKQIFHYRTCQPGQGRPCFDYTIGRCAGPCVGAVGPWQYQKIIKNIISFLKGQMQPVIEDLEDQMRQAAKSKRYEKAAQLRDQLVAINRLKIGQKVIGTKKSVQDVISIYQQNGLAAVNLFKIRHGYMVEKRNFIMERASDMIMPNLISEFIMRYYPLTTDWPREIIVAVSPKEKAVLKQLTGAKITVPQRGLKKKLIAMGNTNARDWLQRSQQAQAKRQSQAQLALSDLAEALHINLPVRIEAYDISNIQGVNSVGSMVVFHQGQPKNSDYRKFNIRTVKGIDDPAMLAEIVRRRFASDKLKSLPRPDLIILDGGRGQLSVVDKHIPKELKNIPLVALAKRHEEIYRRNRSLPIRLVGQSPSYFLIQRIRDEAHRFAIGGHRRRHRAVTIHSKLDDVPGIGPQTRRKLLAKFGSLDGVLKASTIELTKIVNEKIVKKIYENLS